ncbi:MAG: beta-lactamase family protein [Bacteroidales bacterium]|nr:beta-lactamase family protein [Bacteroidales bacterium]
MKARVLMTIVLGLFFFVLYTSCKKDDEEPESGNLSLDEYLDKTVTEKNIPGVVAAILDSNGILLIESAGVRKVGASEQITNNDLFHLGSCTKAMTSALMATLVADNDIQWETTIIDVFPELIGIIHPDYHNVTLHQLLTHRGGIEGNATDWDAYDSLEIKERRLSIMRDNLKDPGQFNAGEYNYSNLGYMIAGCMAERITGQSWETFMNDRLFVPLGMSTAGFGPPNTKDQVDQPWGHAIFLSGWQPLQLDNPEALGPAGTVHASIEDWGRFITLFLKHGNTKILERDIINKLIDPVEDYACGWSVVQRDWANGTAITHAGSNTMWYVTVWIAPEINRAFIAGTNSYNENTATVCDKILVKLIEKYQDPE